MKGKTHSNYKTLRKEHPIYPHEMGNSVTEHHSI